MGIIIAIPFVDEHPTLTQWFLIAALFAFGYLEGPILKQKTSACVTWMLALLGLTGSLAYQFGMIGLSVGLFLLVAGVGAMIGYHKGVTAKFWD